MANELNTRPIPELPVNPSPSASASLVGVDGGVVGLIPSSALPSGGGASIIYATEKPSTPQQAIYVITEDEVVKAEIVQSETILPLPNYIEIVDELPEIGELMIDMATETFYMYYLTIDGGVYAYADANLSAAVGMPEGWTDLVQVGMVTVINAIEEGTDGEYVYVLITKQPKTRVYVPLPDGTFLELTSGIRTRFDAHSGNVSITEM